MENMNLQPNFTIMEHIEFEEKVEIDNLLLSSNPIKKAEIESHDIKQEPIEQEKHSAVFESDLHVGKKMEKNILILYEELDKDLMDFGKIRSQKIRQFVEKIEEYDSVNRQMLVKIVSLKAKIVEINDEHKIAMSLNAKNMNIIVKMHEKAMERKTNELAIINQELQSSNIINQELLQKIEELRTIKNTFATKSSEKLFSVPSLVQPYKLKNVEIIIEAHIEKEFLDSTETVDKTLKEGDCVEQTCTADCEPSLCENEDKKGKKGVKKTMFKCSQCDTDFYKERCLKEHIKIVHEGKSYRDSIHECPQCDKRFSKKSTLGYHIKIVHKNKEDDSNLLTKKTGTLRNKHIDEVDMGKRTFMCRDCGNRFIERTQLKDHIQVVHEKNKSHQHPISGKRIGFKHNIDDRIQVVHGKNKPYKCSRCDYTCTRQNSLENHVKEVHDDNQPFACSLCNCKFGLKSRLNHHIKEDHEKQSRQNCSLCSRTFSHIGRLNAHMVLVHEGKKGTKKLEGKHQRSS